LVPGPLVLPGMGAAGRPAVIAGLVMLVWWLANRIHVDERQEGGQPVRWLLLALSITTLAAYALGLDRGLLPIEVRSADRYLLVMASLAGVALTVADGLRDRAGINRVVGALVFFASISAVLGSLQFVGVDLVPHITLPGLVANSELVGLGQRGGPEFNRVYGTQQHYIEFGVVLSMVFPLAVHHALTAPPGAIAIARWVMAILIASAVPFSISRAGFLGLVIGFTVLIAAWPLRMKLRALLLAAIGLVAFRALVPGVLGTIQAAFTNYENDPSIINRRSDYAPVVAYIEDRPLLGRGPGTFLPESYRLLDNQMLKSLLEVGVLGASSLLAIYLAAFFMGRSVRRRAICEVDGHLGQALAASAAVSFVTAFTFDALFYPAYSGVLFVVLGLVGSLWRLHPLVVPRRS
jgi:O-antigen ligase